MPREYLCAATMLMMLVGLLLLLKQRDALKPALGVLVVGYSVALLLILAGYRREVAGMPPSAASVRAAAAVMLLANANAWLMSRLAEAGRRTGTPRG